MAGIYNRIEPFAKLAQVTAIVIGILSAVYSLFHAHIERRLSGTAEFGKEYSASIKNDLFDLIVEWNRFMAAHGGLGDRKEPEQRALVLSFFDDIEREKKILNLVEFFDGVAVCIQSRACDRNSAIDLFSRNGELTFELFYFFIEDRKTTMNETFGEGGRSFLQMEHESILARIL